MRRDAAAKPNQKEDSNGYIREQKTGCVACSARSARKAFPEPVGNSKTNSANPDSKQSRVVTMLRAPTGATIAGMMKATGWQKNSVRGFLAGVVRKRLNLTLTSEKVNGNRVYQIAGINKVKSQSRRSKTRTR
jgi:hypothetical protein